MELYYYANANVILEPGSVGQICWSQNKERRTEEGQLEFLESVNITRWWFQIYVIFTPPWVNDPIWLIFFEMDWNHHLD